MSDGIRLLDTSNIEEAIRLSRLAGWNQTEADWRRVIELEPEGCFGLESEGALTSTTTAVCYGRELAWIGMVLTDPAFRGRGFARRLMLRAMEFLEARRVTVIGLDATDMGRPLYLSLGFKDLSAIERWGRPAGLTVPKITRPPQVFKLDPELDCDAFGAHRTELLETLASDWSESIPGEGFAMGRPGANAAFFGPCVAHTKAAACDLLASFLSSHQGQEIYWDLLPQNENALELAREFGFECRRRLTRMTVNGARWPHKDARVYAIAGFEYG